MKPKNKQFFYEFSEAMEVVNECTILLQDIFYNTDSLSDKVKKMKELEKKCDVVTHGIVDLANRTFVAPFDAEDIYRLARTIDDIADYSYSAAEKISLYRMTNVIDYTKKMSDDLVEMTKQLIDIVSGIEHISKNKELLLEKCRNINKIEKSSDCTYREGVAFIFDKISDPVEIIKQKELCEYMEETVDTCNDLAECIKGLVLKYA